jgi:hypothetical protein
MLDEVRTMDMGTTTTDKTTTDTDTTTMVTDTLDQPVGLLLHHQLAL